MNNENNKVDCRKHNSGATSPHPMCNCAGPCLLENLPQKEIDYVLKVATSDAVNRPSHYTDGKIEVIDYIKDKKLNFNTGNAVKYVSRAGKKMPVKGVYNVNKHIEDLEKAVWYLNREISDLREAYPGSRLVSEK